MFSGLKVNNVAGIIPTVIIQTGTGKYLAKLFAYELHCCNFFAKK
jgi:hypothetical protein